MIENYTTAGLLRDGDGQCGSWARLFLDTLAAQGITYDCAYIQFQPTDGIAGFLVKNWGFVGNGVSGVPGYRYLNLEDPPCRRQTYYAWLVSSVVPEVIDLPGIPGQGPTNNPASLFNNHQIVKVGATYYDPSYGATYGSFSEIAPSAIDAYFLHGLLDVSESIVDLDLNGDGDKADVVRWPVFVFDENVSADQLMEQCYEYPLH